MPRDTTPRNFRGTLASNARPAKRGGRNDEARGANMIRPPSTAKVFVLLGSYPAVAAEPASPPTARPARPAQSAAAAPATRPATSAEEIDGLVVQLGAAAAGTREAAAAGLIAI